MQWQQQQNSKLSIYKLSILPSTIKENRNQASQQTCKPYQYYRKTTALITSAAAMAVNPSSALTLLLVVSALFLGFLSSASAAANNILYPGSSLLSGQSLTQGDYSLTMQGDCNLVLYHSRRPVWASQTYGRGAGCRAVMQKDGNLVVYTGNGTPVWASHTQRGNGNCVLILQPNGDVVMYGSSIWATGTHTCDMGDGMSS